MGFERRPIDALDLVIKMGKAAWPLIRSNCKPQEMYEEMYEAMLDVIAAAPAVSVEQKWTPISDPPKKPGRYLVATPYGVSCEYYHIPKYVQASFGLNDNKDARITHWAHLPAPPKEVTTDGSNRNS